MDADFCTNRHLQTHQDFCFQDASVVLLAGRCHFMVHKGLLARHSPVLAAAFKDGTFVNCFRGLPVLQVQDSSQDMVFFLLALYDGTYVPYLCSDPKKLALAKFAFQVRRARLCQHLCCLEARYEIQSQATPPRHLARSVCGMA